MSLLPPKTSLPTCPVFWLFVNVHILVICMCMCVCVHVRERTCARAYVCLDLCAHDSMHAGTHPCWLEGNLRHPSSGLWSILSFETGFLIDLELGQAISLGNQLGSACLFLLYAGIRSTCQHAWIFFFLNMGARDQT